jgi:tetratricopeptide (TPR) repeat protein
MNSQRHNEGCNPRGTRKINPRPEWLAILAAIALATVCAPAQQPGQLGQDAAAMLVLDSARRAFNEQKYAVAAERFREFLRTAPDHREKLRARYGLGVALLNSPEKNYKDAIESLQIAASAADLPERPLALYFLGVAERAQGLDELAQAAAKPNEAEQRRNNARTLFEQASKRFASASEAFAGRVKNPRPDSGSATDREWLTRARCDQAETLLRANKFAEAREISAALTGDAAANGSPCRELALYQLGYANFALKDYVAAGRALSQLAPFAQDFGVHARYLLARVHHLSGERPEAAQQYNAVLGGFDAQRKAAQEALKKPDALKPDERANFEKLANGPTPDYVPRAAFYSAVLLFDEGKFGEAQEKLSTWAQQNSKSPLTAEAQLRRGFCFVHLKNWAEAAKTLEPLRDHPQLGDQALWWLARAQVGAADPNNTQAYDQAVRGAIDNLRRASDRAGELTKNDPDAKRRRADILIELADTQQLAKQFTEAADTCARLLAEKPEPALAEEAMQRQAAALHLAGRFKESDDVCAKFEKTFPASTLLADVLFRAAENAYLGAAAADAANNRDEAKRLLGDAVKRYQRVIEKYPEFQHVQLARHGLASAHYRLGNYADTLAILGAIPESERTGDLWSVPYLMADCLIRTLPAEAEDALSASRLIEQAEDASKLLDGFVTANPKSTLTADALLKLGHGYQRVGVMLIDPAEKKKTLTQAKEAYEKLTQQFGNSPAQPTAIFEHAKCLALLGHAGGAADELAGFQRDPLRNSPNAPLALLQLSTLLRAQGKAADAVRVIGDCRAQFEGALAKDPARAGWLPMLQYEHALAVKESGKLADALPMFDEIAKKFAGAPEAANAVWRAAQCRREDLTAQLATAQKAAAKPDAKPDEIAAANKAVETALAALWQAVAPVQTKADELGKKNPGAEASLRMIYEIAWCHRALAEAEIKTAKEKARREAVERIQAQRVKDAAASQAAMPRPPETSDAPIPLQPAEKLAREAYQRIIATAPDAPVANLARIELSELLTARNEDDTAIDLLADALEKDTTHELTEKIRVRLASAFLAKGDPKSALLQTDAVLKNSASPLTAEAAYLAGEARIRAGDWAKAIEQLQPFRDKDTLRHVPDISDRALLRLGHAQAQAGQWDASRQTLDALVQRFAQSPWVNEARYGIGWSFQQQKNYDAAIGAYGEAVKRTASEVAARSQLQIGLCRLEQKRYPEAVTALLAVPFTYDYPQWNAPAWCEAGRAYMELQQRDDAVKAWKRVVQETPSSPWAKIAQERLAAVK